MNVYIFYLYIHMHKYCMYGTILHIFLTRNRNFFFFKYNLRFDLERFFQINKITSNFKINAEKNLSLSVFKLSRVLDYNSSFLIDNVSIFINQFVKYVASDSYSYWKNIRQKNISDQKNIYIFYIRNIY